MGRDKRYFDMYDDVYVEGRWHLVGPMDENGVDLKGLFRRGKPVTLAAPVRVAHSDAAERGAPLDYSLISGTIPLVRLSVAKLLERLAPGDIECVPAIVDGFSEEFYVVNVLTTKRCIDDAACAYIKKFTQANIDLFPDKVGHYMRVSGLRIDKTKVGDAQVFWTWGWPTIIVAQQVKEALEAAQVTGVKFIEV